MTESILVVGANGYLALHVIKLAIGKGLHVIGTIRSDSASKQVHAAFPDSPAQLSLVRVPDITKVECFEKAFDLYAIKAVINTASPLINKVDDVRSQILDPAIQSGVAILEAAARLGGESLQRVIHVSSFTAILDLSLGLAPGKTYTPEDWNPLTYEEAAAGDSMTAYMGSKALAERAMWNWVRDTKPTFDFVSVNPAAIFGPHVGSIDLNCLNLSTQMLWELVMPSPQPPPYNSYHLGSWVDVRDVAEALLAAVEIPEAGGERFLVAQRCHWQLIRDEARRVLPELEEKIDAGVPGAWKDAQVTTYDLDGSKVDKLLKTRYRSLAECMKDTYSQLLECSR